MSDRAFHHLRPGSTRTKKIDSPTCCVIYSNDRVTGRSAERSIADGSRDWPGDWSRSYYTCTGIDVCCWWHYTCVLGVKTWAQSHSHKADT